MEFYIYLALIVLLLSLVKGTDNKVVYIGVTFALFFLAAYRSLGVGTDSEAYYTIYYQYANNDAYVAANDNYKTAEFIWLAMLRYFRNADNYRGLLVMLAALNAIPLFYALKKQSKWPLFSVFLYIALYFYGNSLNAIGHPLSGKRQKQILPAADAIGNGHTYVRFICLPARLGVL